jgi:hypothetical protein
MGKYETVHNLQFYLILWFNTNHQLQSSHQITQIPIYYYTNMETLGYLVRWLLPAPATQIIVFLVYGA